MIIEVEARRGVAVQESDQINPPFKLPKEYLDYIKSSEWITKSKQFRQGIKHCERCKRFSLLLHCHHKSYKNFRNEKRKDILILCPKCHHKYHYTIGGKRVQRSVYKSNLNREMAKSRDRNLYVDGQLSIKSTQKGHFQPHI